MIGLITQEGELTLAEVSFMGKEINMSSGVNSTGQAYALDMQKVSKRFPGTLAVDKVDFRVKKGEVHALMGENGAGKSTLMKMLNGLFNDYTGDIYINGEKKLLHSPTMAKHATMADYRRATGFEALMGYLYLKEDFSRITELVYAGIGKDKL